MKMTQAQIVSSLLAILLSASAFAGQDCSPQVAKARYESINAAAAEKIYKELYEDARHDNIVSTSIFIPSALVFTVVGAIPTLAAGSAGTGTLGLVLGAPGVTLGMSISNALHLSNIVIPMVLGWGSQLVPTVYALGHGAYRLVHEDQVVDLTSADIAQTVSDLEDAQKKLDLDKAAIYKQGDYSQLVDGLLLGSLDRNYTLKLYNNARASLAVANAKHKLMQLQCN